MHVLVLLTNAITTYVYGVCVKITIIYGATFGPPFVFLHQMINRFKYHHQYQSELLPLDPCRLRGSVGGVHLSSIPAGPSRRTAAPGCRSFKTNEILTVLKK